MAHLQGIRANAKENKTKQKRTVAREEDTGKLNVTPKVLDEKYTVIVKDIYSIKERADSHWNKEKDDNQVRPPFPVLTSILISSYCYDKISTTM